MKKPLSIALTTLFALGLSGCVEDEIPKGISSEFYYDARDVFAEIDEDTMELEPSDQQDILNLELLIDSAMNDKEKKIASQLSIIADKQQAVIDGDRTATREYLKARTMFSRLMELQVPEFEFVEED
jgi:hypothetical protein